MRAATITATRSRRPTLAANFQNGRLPDSVLAPIAGGRLRRDAAAAWNAMNVESRRRGLELRPTGSRSSYRDFATQQHFWNTMARGMAARPGTSNHGWGTAVDVATPAMRQMIDRIGAPFGWAKKWSDAPHEWWHLTFRTGIWSGPDPGPYGTARPTTPTQAPKAPEGTVRLKTVLNRDGRLEVFVQRQGGQILHTWQVRPNGGWAGSAKGRVASWYSLGNPGKGVDMDVVVRRDGAIVVFVRRENGQVMRRSQSKANGAWKSGWASLGNPGK